MVCTMVKANMRNVIEDNDDDIGAGIIIKAWLGAISMFLLIVLISIFIMGF